MGQLTAFDLAVILLIANAVQNAMVGSDVSVTGGTCTGGSALNSLVSPVHESPSVAA